MKTKRKNGISGSCLVCLKKLPRTSFEIEHNKKKIGDVCSNDCEAVVWRINLDKR